MTLNEPIDIDFDRAATYYCTRSMGNGKQATLTELKRRYHEDEDLDSLVHLFAQHRTPSESHLTFPTELPQSALNGLTKHILIWLNLEGKLTPKRLFAHLMLEDITPPDWLVDHDEMKNLSEVPSQNTKITLVFKALMYDFTNGNKP